MFIIYLLWIFLTLEVCAQTGYQEAIGQGLRLQMQADSMQRRAEALTLALAAAPEAEKSRIRIAIRNSDAQAVALQKKADEWFAQAVAFETPIVAADTALSADMTDLEAIAEAMTEKTETVSIQEPEFAILPAPPYSAARPIPVDDALPDGVVYKIQLGAFSKPVVANTFKGMTPLSGETSATGITKYYVGLFRKFAAADEALRKVRDYGFKDAFIVAFYNRRTITQERARQLE